MNVVVIVDIARLKLELRSRTKGSRWIHLVVNALLLRIIHKVLSVSFSVGKVFVNVFTHLFH